MPDSVHIHKSFKRDKQKVKSFWTALKEISIMSNDIDFNNTVNQCTLTDIYKTFHPSSEEHTLLLTTYG